jgi:hypothetical protein
MHKYYIEIDGKTFEVVTNSTMPKILGKFSKITKRTFPNQPNVYRAYNKVLYDTVDLTIEKIMAIGYKDAVESRGDWVFDKNNNKLGRISEIPKILNQPIINFIEK